MAKIGTLTFHAVTNYGAVLQAYALQRVIESKGHGCEILNYQNTIIEDQYKVFSKSNLNIRHPKRFLKNLFLIPSQRKRNISFKQFRKKYLKLSEQTWNENKLPCANEYDAIIAGSDQIWNFKCNGNDTHYFLDFVDKNKCRCYSYAASLSTNDFAKTLIEKYKYLLEKFSGISVREKSSALFLESILDKNVETNIDPTLLLSFDEWKELAKEPESDKYVLVFLMTHSKKILDEALEFANKRGLKMIYINLYEPFIDKKFNSLFSVTPEEWLGYIKKAEYVITNSFHGTVFSIIFQRKFMTCLIKDGGKNERLYQLMEFTGLKERLKEGDAPILDTEIDYELVNSKIQMEREKSMNYLESILNEVSMS